MDIRHNKRAAQHSLKLDTSTQVAMAEFWRHRWPSNTAKLGAREFNLTIDQARSVVAARASQTTLDQIIKAGGWPVLFAVGARVLCQGADQYLTELRASHHEDSERLGALLGGWGPVPPAGRDHTNRDNPEERERRNFADRRVG